MNRNRELYLRGLLTLQEVVEYDAEAGDVDVEWVMQQMESWFEGDQKRFDQVREQNAVALKYGWTAMLVKPS